MSKLLNASLPALLHATCGEPVVLEAAAGDAADAPKKFSAVAYTGGVMRVAMFSQPVVIDLAGVKVPIQSAPVLRQHNDERPIGHSNKIEVTAQKIKVSGELSYPGDDTDKVTASASKGYPWQISVGVFPDRTEYVDRGQSVKVNGRNFTGPLIVVRASTYRETSFVTLGADSQTSAYVAAKLSEGDPMTFSEWLKAKGVDEATTPPATIELLRAAYKAEQTPAPEPTPKPKPPVNAGEGGDVGSVIQAQRAENLRTSGIASLVAKAAKGSGQDKLEELQRIGEQAVRDGWDLNQTETRLLIAGVAQAAPLVYSSSRGDVSRQVVECAFARTVGLQSAEKVYTPQVLEAADKHFRRGVGLLRMIDICAKQAGFRDTVDSDNYSDALRLIGRSDLRAAAGPSTYSLSGMLTDTAEKIVREQFMYVEREYDKLCSKRSVKNFQQVKAYSLTGDMTYRLIPAGGELKHVKAGEKSYANQIDSYGGMMTMDRRDMINDDIGVYMQILKRFGRGGALTMVTAFWDLVLAALAAGHFDTTHSGDGANGGNGGSNYDDGTDTTFSSDGLIAADLLWAAITDKDGKPMNHKAKFCVVPYALRIAAARLFGSPSFGAADEEGTSNPWAGAFELVASKYLTSSKAWFLWADPNDIPFIELALLNGKELPTVETVEPSADYLGLTVRGYHDFGYAVQEWRGAAMFKGEA